MCYRPQASVCGRIFSGHIPSTCSRCWIVSLTLIVGGHFYPIATQMHATPIAGDQIGRLLGYARNAGIWGLIWGPEIGTDGSRRFIQGVIDKYNHTPMSRCYLSYAAMAQILEAI